MNTLLLTATIKPFVKVVHNDPEIRCEEYRRALKKYICNTDFDRIIFAENSGYYFNTEEMSELAKGNDKEFIYLDLSESANESSMSTGEARLMRRVIEECVFLKDDDVIWKATGRIYIRNANRILHLSHTPPEKTICLYMHLIMTHFKRGFSVPELAI